MGQFKPMVKMETTEPSVILKLAKGGHVAMKSKGEEGHKPTKKMDGGAMAALAGTPALVGRPALNAPVAAPGRPSMNDRRKAMMMAQMMKQRQAAQAMPAPVMKKGGKAEGGKMDESQDKAMLKKAFKQHDTQEHKGGKGTKLALKTGGVAMGAAGYASGGGVKMGNGGGFKKGGKVNRKANGGAMSYVDGNVAGTPPGKTNTTTGGVKKGNAGGYKKGGSAKKFADGGGLMGVLGAPSKTSGFSGDFGGGGDAGAGLGQVNLGAGTIGKALSTAAQAIGGGGGGGANLSPPPNVPGGPMKKGGSAKKAYATGGSVNSGRPVAMPEGRKKPSAPVSINQLSGTFKKGGSVKKLNDGGDAQSDKETKGYKGTYATQKAENLADREAMNPMNYIRPLVDKVKGMFGSSDAPGAVTKTKESTTIVPKRRSGGMANC